MATKTTAAPGYDEERRYDVRLTRSVPLYGAQLLPLDPHDMGGADLNRLVAEQGADCVDTAEPR